jgi:hypothetical protein
MRLTTELIFHQRSLVSRRGGVRTLVLRSKYSKHSKHILILLSKILSVILFLRATMNRKNTPKYTLTCEVFFQKYMHS